MQCRQIGAELHELTPALPLYDGVTGQAVLQATDSRVERLRDVLMDDARERVDNLGEDLVAGNITGSEVSLQRTKTPLETCLNGRPDQISYPMVQL